MADEIYRNPHNGELLIAEGLAAVIACGICLLLSGGAFPALRTFAVILSVTVGCMGLVWMNGGICQLLLRRRIKQNGVKYTATVNGRRRANIYRRSLLGWSYQLTYEADGQALTFWTKPMWRHHRYLQSAEVTLWVWDGRSYAEGFLDATNEAHSIYVPEYSGE